MLPALAALFVTLGATAVRHRVYYCTTPLLIGGITVFRRTRYEDPFGRPKCNARAPFTSELCGGNKNKAHMN